jgi:hypothetical protein
MAEIEFLVRGECSCGWFMAAAEGSRWPKCPGCGEQVMPPRAAPGHLPSPPNDREGYIAIRLPEAEAIHAVLALKYEGARAFDIREDGKLELRQTDDARGRR